MPLSPCQRAFRLYGKRKDCTYERSNSIQDRKKWEFGRVKYFLKPKEPKENFLLNLGFYKISFGFLLEKFPSVFGIYFQFGAKRRIFWFLALITRGKKVWNRPEALKKIGENIQKKHPFYKIVSKKILACGE